MLTGAPNNQIATTSLQKCSIPVLNKHLGGSISSTPATGDALHLFLHTACCFVVKAYACVYASLLHVHAYISLYARSERGMASNN